MSLCLKRHHRSRPSRARGLPLVGLALAACLAMLPAEARAGSEEEIKAAFLFNFARYVEWPERVFATPDAPLTICMVGAQDFGSVVTDTVSGKRVGSRAVAVVMPEDLEAVDRCQILFVGEDVSVPEVLAALADASVFTVSDRAGFAREGGIANFFRADKKVRFEINADAARRVGIRISSRLLRLAKVVN